MVSYLVNVLMSHREREGETQRKLLVLHVMMVQKVGHALSNVIKELQRRRRRRRKGKPMRHDGKNNKRELKPHAVRSVQFLYLQKLQGEKKISFGRFAIYYCVNIQSRYLTFEVVFF